MEWLLRFISRSILKAFWSDPRHSDSEQPLKSWFAIAKRADWSRPQDIRDQFGTASFVGGNRVVFNIAGKKYRLVVRFNYDYRVAHIRFVGTYAQYDRVNVETV